MAHLRKVRAGGVVADQMFALRADLLRNLGNITNRRVPRGLGAPATLRPACDGQAPGRHGLRRSSCLPCFCACLLCSLLIHCTEAHFGLWRALPNRKARFGAGARPSAPSPHPPGVASSPPCSALHEHFPVIPEPIREYIEEVKAQLEEVTGSPGAPPPAAG